jgi:hypothetical protein
VLGLAPAAHAPHSGCRAIVPGTPSCEYVAVGSHSAIVVVNGDWKISGDKGTALKGTGPQTGLVTVNAPQGEKIKVEIMGSAGVISSGTTSGHP